MTSLGNASFIPINTSLSPVVAISQITLSLTSPLSSSASEAQQPGTTLSFSHTRSSAASEPLASQISASSVSRSSLDLPLWISTSLSTLTRTVESTEEVSGKERSSTIVLLKFDTISSSITQSSDEGNSQGAANNTKMQSGLKSSTIVLISFVCGIAALTILTVMLVCACKKKRSRKRLKEERHAQFLDAISSSGAGRLSFASHQTSDSRSEYSITTSIEELNCGCQRQGADLIIASEEQSARCSKRLNRGRHLAQLSEDLTRELDLSSTMPDEVLLWPAHVEASPAAAISSPPQVQKLQIPLMMNNRRLSNITEESSGAMDMRSSFQSHRSSIVSSIRSNLFFQPVHTRRYPEN